ncbi:MAG: phosphoenolpyruvate mutase, partial [Alphaproteobacteria bacterium]
LAADRAGDFVLCSRPFTADYLEEDPVSLVRIGDALRPGEQHGEWIGLAKLTARGARLVRAELAAMRADGSLARADLPDLFARLLAKGEPVAVAYISGHWLDVNDTFDLATARNFL